jgi:hypothetical protein
MTASPGPERLRSAVDTAGSVTEGISDPQLRAIAFGKVLDRLLLDEPLRLVQPGNLPRGASLPPPKVAAAPSRGGPNAWIDSLVAERFFSEARSLAEITEAVRAQGHNVESKNVTAPLEKLVQSKVLRRERKASETAKRGVWMYSNY